MDYLHEQLQVPMVLGNVCAGHKRQALPWRDHSQTDEADGRDAVTPMLQRGPKPAGVGCGSQAESSNCSLSACLAP